MHRPLSLGIAVPKTGQLQNDFLWRLSFRCERKGHGLFAFTSGLQKTRGWAPTRGLAGLSEHLWLNMEVKIG